jgi:hypothetical protein
MKYFLFLIACLSIASLFSLTKPHAVVLTGTVKDAASHEPLPGAQVSAMQGRQIIARAVTDAKGAYTLSLPQGTYDLECRYTGYTTQRFLGVNLNKIQKDSIDLLLYAGAALNEVVVTDRDPRISRPGRESSEMDDLKIATASAPAARSGETAHLKKAVRSDAITAMPMSKSKGAPAAGKPAPAPPKPAVKYDRVDSEVPAALHYSDELARPATTAAPVDKSVREESKPALDMKSRDMPVASQPAPHAGLLTAGEWNDLHNWNKHWVDLLNDGEIDAHQKMYGFYPQYRFPVLLTNAQDFPVMDASVRLKNAGGETIWEARTDNTGKAELWAGLYDKTLPTGLRVEAEVAGKIYSLGVPKAAKEGINRYQIQVDCNAPKTVDIVWTVDATGSMGDEIEYLKTELLDVIGRAKTVHPELSFRMGTVFYRDKGDDYLTKSSGLSYDISKTVDFIRKQYAGGGGDYPEAVHTALEEAINNQPWSDNAVARICFLVLDASPHHDPGVNESLQRSIREAARRGIRIIPITASGIQKDTEFLMKFFGLATNGTYVFLTDHSGIGGKHLEPTTDEYKVELLNDLLTRIITEYSAIKTCDGQSTIRFENPQQQQQQQNTPFSEAKYYPNPASSQFTLELPFDVQSVTLYDAEGKAVRKIEQPQAGIQTISVSDLPEGFYTIRILKDGRATSGKLMVVRV